MMEVEATSQLVINGRPLGVINTTNIPSHEIDNSQQMREVATELARWMEQGQSQVGSRGSLFDRGVFTPPNNPYDEMRSARHAVRYDSIISGVAEVTEAFAFQGVKWEGENSDESDVFNQLSRDMNLDAVIRRMWREEFMYGQFVCAKLWGWAEYSVRGKTKNGNKRKKTYRIWAPVQMRILDGLKVVPAGIGPLGGETLCWSATPGEIGHYQESYKGDVIDPLMTTFFQGTYNPSEDEARELVGLGVDPTRLLAMNPDWVFRHTLTKPDYERFGDIRLKSVFSLLDLKHQLMQADRATLIGAAKYILLIRKGEKDAPALPEEMANLRENYNFIAKLPVIISDHRLQIDIIAPKQDFVLQGDKYDVIDSRLLARLLGTLSISSKGQRNETQDTLSSSVARVMENRRHMLKRTLEYEVARAVVQHPKNKDVFESTPSLVYTPRSVQLALDATYVQALQALRTQREISRETILEFFGLDQSTEAQRMELEAEFFDDIFKTEIPFNGQPGAGGAAAPAPGGGGDGGDDSQVVKVDPDGTLKVAPAKKALPAKATPKKATPNGTPEAPSVSGARGGRPVGGGTSKKSPAAIAKPKTASGNPSTK
jgi:hypothetical protein